MLTIGIYGSGKVGKRALTRLIPQHIGEEKARFVFLVDSTWSPGQDAVLDYAIENGDPLCILPEGDEMIADLEADQIPYQESEDPYNDFMDLLKASEGDLVIAWDDDAEENLTTFATDAMEDGIDVFDIVHGMRPLTLEAEVADGAEEEQDEEPEAAEADEEEVVEEVDTFEELLDKIDAAESLGDVEELLLLKDNRDQLIELAEALHLDFNPSSWQKKIVPVVLDALKEDEAWMAGDLDIRQVIEAVHKDTMQEKAPEPEEEPETVEAPEEDPVKEEGPLQPTAVNMNVSIPRPHKGEIAYMVRDVVCAHGTEEAAKFLALLRKENLL